MPPGSYDMVNPWWSQRIRDEVELRSKRPETLPAVPCDGDEDLEGPVEGPEAVPLEGTGGRIGKGRGSAAERQSGRGFVTPPSHSHGHRSEGRGGGGARQTEGRMPEEGQPGQKVDRRPDRSMGPVPPEESPPAVKLTGTSEVARKDPESLQRAFEAEMVLFLREQNSHLQAEVERLRSLQQQQPMGTMSTPSSWETVDGGTGDGLRGDGAHEHVHGGVGPSGHDDRLTGGVSNRVHGGEVSLSTPRGRSPTTRRPPSGHHVRYTPNGTQIPCGPPPPEVIAPPVPPFPTSVSAEIQSASAGFMFQDYESLEVKRRQDSQWAPLHLREGKSFVPFAPPEPRAEHLERMREGASWAQSAACSKDVPPTSSHEAGFHRGSECQGYGWGSDRRPGVDRAFDRFSPGAVGDSHYGNRKPSPELRERGEPHYGRWPGDGGTSPMPLPWGEGGGNSKAELAELAADASPLELGDWLAVNGPVLRDLSSVSARWWNLTLREAQCFYDRWKTSSPLERVQIAPRLPDELYDSCYQRTEQRGVNLLLRAIPADQQQALITARELNSTALLFRLMVRYQPGGSGEKAILLAKLTTLDKATGATDLAASLRSWRRHFARAQEIEAVLPDGTLLLKALEPACSLVASLDAQASFRLAQSRLQLAIDQQPIHQSIWRFSQCLLAEAETLSLMINAPPTTPSPIKVKQLEASQKQQTSGAGTGEKGKGGNAGVSTTSTPCRYFRSDAGCKAGKNCKWSHSWEGVEDKNARCWICGSKEHRKTECRLKSQGKPSPAKDTKDGKNSGEPGSGSGGGKGASKSSSSSNVTAANQAPIKVQEMEVCSDGGGQVQDSQSNEGASKGGETGATSTTSEALLQEATKLLKSLRVPQLRVIKISQLEHEAGDLVLLDSGATHALRPAKTWQEWQEAAPTQVTLADGITSKLRLKPSSKVLLSDPQDEAMGKSWIVPLGGIAELGYKFEWKGSLCGLRDERGQELTVTVQHGCPMVTRAVGQEMIDQLEQRQNHVIEKALLVKALLESPQSSDLASLQDSTELALTVKLKALFPALPDEILMRIIPDLTSLHQGFDGHLLPWNRRKRRRLDKAKQIVLHLFSGPDTDYWQKTLQRDGVEVLCIDLQAPIAADLHDDHVFRFLLSLAASGRVKALVGGPPCRTVSALRYQDDGGPGILRTEQYPYGLPTLSPSDAELVNGDSVLLFRMLALYVLCEDVRLPQEPQTALAIEQPEDPAKYRPEEEVRRKQFMSIWRTKEWQDFATTYQVKLINFDQGPMGHIKKKPTSLAFVMRDLQVLNEVRGPPSGVQPEDPAPDRNQMTMQERCAESKQWAAWAPGLKVALVLALQDHLHRGSTPSLEAALRPLGQVALDGWRQHYLNDHMPARRDCKHCVRSAARSKPHKRISHPEAYTLSVDLSGKMVIGQDQHRQDCKYMMVAVYTFPVDGSGRALAEVECGDLAQPGSAAVEPPSIDAEEYTPTEPGGDDPGDDMLGEEPHEIPGEDDGEKDGGAVKKGPEAFEAWQKTIEEAQDVMVRNLTFVEVLPGRAVTHILPALAKIYAKLRGLGLPLYRLHCDRARELISAPVRRWTLDRGITTTLTSGDSYKSNGRVEGELGVVKKHVRTVLTTTGLGLEMWPLAATHIGERRLRGQLRSLGFPIGPLLRFGSRAYALKKSWQDRYQPWREIRDEVVVLGPALQSSMTTTSYYVQSLETKRFFYTDDVVVPSPNQPEADEALVHLPVLSDPPRRPAWQDGVPRRRLTEKTAIPQVSMLHMEGEDAWCQNWLCKHRELFDACSPNNPELFQVEISSDSWTIETPEREASCEGGSQGAETQSSVSMVEDSSGGGEKEGAPNNQCGGSSLVAPKDDEAPGNIPLTRVQFIRSVQANLATYIGEEIGHLDITNPDQGSYMEVLTNAVMNKVELEEELLHCDHNNHLQEQKEMEEEFLVTKTVAAREVLDDFENWTPSITAEHTQLVTTKRAVEQITKEDLHDRAAREGKTIELLPAKMVYTRKAGTGARRARAVCCGNYSETRFDADSYAGGADGCQVRALVRTASLKGWAMAATDIRVAFLNAPRREDGKLVAMEIPSVYRRLGLAREGEVWLVKLAMYGLTTSPRDWSQYRDTKLPQMSWTRQKGDREVRGSFCKTADENLWRLEEVDSISGERIWSGLMSVYVDDILLTGEEGSISAALDALRATWATSSIEWASSTNPVHFCGFEIAPDVDGDGYHIAQNKYEQEILARWQVTRAAAFPNFKVSEADGEQQPDIDRNQIKEAQALAGSLLWLSTRSRPDLAYGVAALSRLVTRNPGKAIEIGHELLAYVKHKPGDLHYPRYMHNPWGARSQLKVQRHEKLLEVFADIAYGTGNGHKSMQGLVLCFAGAPVAWQSSTQPFVCHSTAEAELVSYCEALNAGRATEALLCAMWGEQLVGNTFERVIYGDNAAAIGLAHGNSATSWRTRHLRVRSNILREALEGQSLFPGGPWKLIHLKGTELVADGMTKPLVGQSFTGFQQDLGLRSEVQVKRMVGGGQPLQPQPQERQVALRALLAGGLLVQAAEAHGGAGSDETFGNLWLCGLVLIVIGAIWVARTICASVHCCLRRLQLLSSKLHVSGDELEFEEGVITTPLPSRRPRSRSSTTRKKGVGEASPTEDEADNSPSSEEETTLEAQTKSGERGLRLRSSMARTMGQKKGGGSSSSRPLDLPSERVIQAACAAADEAGKAAESAEIAAHAAEQAAEQAIVAGHVAEKAMVASERLHRAVVQTSHHGGRKRSPSPTNPWNKFQKAHSGKGWSIEKMRAEYYKAKSLATKP